MAQDPVTFVSKDGMTNIEVYLQDGSAWLDLNGLSKLLERDEHEILKAFNEIFESGKANRNPAAAFLKTPDGAKIRCLNVEGFLVLSHLSNLPLLSEFRKWAEAKKLPGFVSLQVIDQFAKDLSLLFAYDEDTLPKLPADELFIPSFDYNIAMTHIKLLKEKYIRTGEASDLFGFERDGALKGILGALDQTFAGEPLYKSVYEYAAHLLYFIIKDHPFSDGNKRIGSSLFLLYLRLQNINSPRITGSAIVVMALMVAVSDPKDKERIIDLIINLI